MPTQLWMIDTSALMWLSRSPDLELWTERIRRGLVRVTTGSLLEVGYTARSSDEVRSGLTSPPISFMPVEYLTLAIEVRALEVQALLAAGGHHRAPSAVDLLVAAAAERAGLTVLHVDKDFDLIALATGQPVERLTIPEN